ncbi:MAG: acyl-CoA dehydrogenase family protein [Chloroflexi bacterium]|jgi:alkylation response protein AidB-like acyl-CoA dehydrogenase|nr:MAG: acyl-CoA dehydrogenase [Chloroflexi bacterium OLB13]MBC6955427.1 butyryl-CoA dehydrogenase [Chloroflexota bacterium]MBV6436644.1 Acyl-CoA dehydrogenase [Anaerolineae bacterium]MDL1917355.1 butyryl-CoA dehydrogenase [Anaerolineae bacterium CFX4]OQY85642.1 MAG: butyryl-CoA dehydrogenase [Anaerolineae bacterium UTCFX5]
MDFALTEEHRQVQKMVRDWAAKEVIPVVGEWDRKQEMNPTFLPRMAELGILGISIPVRYGGQGFDYISLGLVCEELERADTHLRVVMSVHHGLNSQALLQWGSEEQKQRFLVPQARGEQYAAFCLTEPGAGSDVASMNATARKVGDTYILNGEKMWISLATKAHNFLVVAKTDPTKGHAGMSAFLVTRDMPGVTTGDIHGKLGVRAGSTGWVAMQDVEVPAANRLGEEGEGFKIAMSCLDNGRFTVAAGATGLIRACLEDSIKYAMERETFGKPIAQHQLVKQKIAFMRQWYDSASLLVWRAGWLKNQGVRNTRETSMAKWYATDHSVKAALEAIQVHGAYGFSDEYPVERYLRNSKGAVIYEGTSEIHQLMQADYAFGFREDKPLRCEMPAYDVEYFQGE